MTEPSPIRSIDIIIPALNDASRLEVCIHSLKMATTHARKQLDNPPRMTIIVADGGSTDNTVQVARAANCHVLQCPRRGRGYQLAAGWDAGTGEVAVMIHADATVHETALTTLIQALHEKPGIQWGILGHGYDRNSFRMSVVRFMNRFRFHILAIAFGDQGIFCRRDALKQAGGIPSIPLMEDVELSLRLRRYKRVSLGQNLTISTRKWDQHSFLSYFMIVTSFVSRYLIARLLGRNVDTLSHELYRKYYRIPPETENAP